MKQNGTGNTTWSRLRILDTFVSYSGRWKAKLMMRFIQMIVKSFRQSS